MAQAKIINIEDAKLQTLTVEIKAITVNGRQMTLSTFRQLPESHIWGHDYVLMGVPWGLVRYYWGDLCTTGFHVVWQKDRTLFRCFVTRRSMMNCKESEELDQILDRVNALEGKLEKRSQFIYKHQHPEEYAAIVDQLEKLRPLLKDAKARLCRRDEREFALLECLPQLFIAV